MGLLTSAGPPSWHPASPELLAATVRAAEESASKGRSLADLATGYCIRHTGGAIPLVVGFSRPEEVHECVRVWREIEKVGDEDVRIAQEEAVKAIFKEAGVLDWEWASPP